MPKETTRKNNQKRHTISVFIILLIILLSFVVGAFFYPQMPNKIASHWNAQGEVNGYMSKFWGIFSIPIVFLALFFVFFIIPKIDPLKDNINKFIEYFDNFIIIFFLFMFYFYLLTLFFNMGIRFNILQLLSPAFSLLFFYAGIMMENVQKNWFIGIRTPWTLSNDKVWEKTHTLGGKLYKVAGIMAFGGLFFPNLAILLIISPALVFSVYTSAYSYFEYKKI